MIEPVAALRPFEGGYTVLSEACLPGVLADPCDNLPRIGIVGPRGTGPLFAGPAVSRGPNAQGE